MCKLYIESITRFFFYKQLHFWVQPGVAKALLQFQPQSCLMVASSVQISALVAYELLVVFNISALVANGLRKVNLLKTVGCSISLKD